MNQEEILKEYAEALLAERGVSDDVPGEVRDKMRDDILERLNNFLIARIVEKLPPEKIAEVDGLIQAGSDEKVSKYIKENVDNFEKFSLDAMVDFRKKYLEA